MKRYIPIEDVINIRDESRLWWCIPGFRGYEVSSDHIIRSMKHFKKYPFGILIQAKKDRDGKILHPENPTFELSDNNSERVLLTLSEIVQMAYENKDKYIGYPRKTITTNRSSRTPQIFKNKSRNVPFDKEKKFPKFTIIKDQEESSSEDPGLIYPYIPKITIPIESDRGEYFGRKDHRTF